jgi:excisionase family DNA binding protein
MASLEKHYRIKQVSELIGIAEYTIRGWIKRGSMPAVHAGGSILVRESDLAKWLDDRRTVGGVWNSADKRHMNIGRPPQKIGRPRRSERAKAAS